MQLLTAYSLSRGAPSASRASLRNDGRARRPDAKDTGYGTPGKPEPLRVRSSTRTQMTSRACRAWHAYARCERATSAGAAEKFRGGCVDASGPSPHNWKFSAPVAQLDRVPGYELGGREFESLRARHYFEGTGCLGTLSCLRRRKRRSRKAAPATCERRADTSSRGIAQSGSAPALGAGCRGFESLYPDHPDRRKARREVSAGCAWAASPPV